MSSQGDDVENEYVPLPWQTKAHQGDWTHCAVVGGKGSGKSLFSIEELKACALEYPGTTWLVARKTVPSLKDSTWKDLLRRVPDRIIKSYNKAERNIELINGSMFIGRSLDEPKKFDSIEISGFLLDEGDENEKEVYDTLKSRVRQKYRDGLVWKYPRYRTILSINPTDEDHWIPRLFLNNPPHDHKIFFSNTMENQGNLPPGYIEQLRAIYSPDMQQRMIYGMFGRVHKGRPVFPQFIKGNYIRDRLEHDKNATIFRGWDFGYNRPAVVWLQFIDGQARVLAEMLGKTIYIQDFLPEVLEYQKTLFGEHQLFRDFCDPHGADEKDTGTTSVQVLNDSGIFPVYRKTFISEGIRAIKDLLDTKNSDGDPNFLIHPRCKVLIEGFRGGYHRADGEENPEKDGYYDHCLAEGTLVFTNKGSVPIEDLNKEHMVLTSSGFRPHLGLIEKGFQEVFEIKLSDGTTIEATSDHKFWVKNVGWVQVKSLICSDVLSSIKECKTYSWSNSMALSSDGIQTIKTLLVDVTTNLMPCGLRRVFSPFIGMCGKRQMVLFLKGFTSTMLTGMLKTIQSKIWNALKQRTTFIGIFPKEDTRQRQKSCDSLAMVLSVKRLGFKKVYDINVPIAHNFYANGILTHNCFDALRYDLIHLTRRHKFNKASSSIEAMERVFIHPVTGRRIHV